MLPRHEFKLTQRHFLNWLGFTVRAAWRAWQRTNARRHWLTAPLCRFKQSRAAISKLGQVHPRAKSSGGAFCLVLPENDILRCFTAPGPLHLPFTSRVAERITGMRWQWPTLFRMLRSGFKGRVRLKKTYEFWDTLKIIKTTECFERIFLRTDVSEVPGSNTNIAEFRGFPQSARDNTLK